MITFQLRTSTPEIAKRLAELALQLNPSNPPHDDVAWLEHILINPLANVFVVQNEDNHIVGMLFMTTFPVVTGYKTWIEEVVVDEQYRGQGISKLLVEAAIQRARELGLPTINLSSKPEREVANKLYQRMGFKINPTNYYRLKL